MKKSIGDGTCREFSTRLLEYGCITLCLYLSGDALAKAEAKSEMWMRGVVEIVYSKHDGAMMNDYNDDGQWIHPGSLLSLLAVSR